MQNGELRLQKMPPYGIVDVFRGLSSLCVVMFHACVYFLFASNGEHAKYVHFTPYLVSIHGQLIGVTAFFVISGYCITNAAYNTLVSGKEVWDYAWARIWRIFPTYYIACVVIMGVELIIAQGQTLDFLQVSQPLFWLANLSMLQTECGQHFCLYAAWTLCYEVLFYALIGAFLALGKFLASSPRKAVAILWYGVGTLTLYSLVSIALFPDKCPFPLDRAYQFGLGGLLFLSFLPNNSGITKWKAESSFFTACLLILTIGFLNDDGGFMVDNLRVGSFRDYCTISVAVAVLLKALRPLDRLLTSRPEIQPFVWLGKISYSLYLMHGLVAALVCEELLLLGFDRDWYWVSYLAQIGASLFFGFLFYYLVERHFLSRRARVTPPFHSGETKAMPGLTETAMDHKMHSI